MNSLESQVFQKGGFVRSHLSLHPFLSKAEIIEKLCEEIHLLEKDSNELKKQYLAVLKYYQKLEQNLFFSRLH